MPGKVRFKKFLLLKFANLNQIEVIVGVSIISRFQFHFSYDSLLYAFIAFEIPLSTCCQCLIDLHIIVNVSFL